MSFFQNLFNQEFRGNWVLVDRQYSVAFTVAANKNSPNNQYAYNKGPWDFSSNGILTINYSWDSEFENYSKLEIDLTGNDASSTNAYEVINILNSNENFSSMFIAEIDVSLTSLFIKSKQNRARKEIKMWISNTGAETKMRFNKKAGVAELPSYFSRHTIENRFSFKDSAGQLILLNETDFLVDVPIIEEAGYVASKMKKDWELLGGRASGLFMFKKMTMDNNSRITQLIEYPAGAKEGDFAKKTLYTYIGSNTNPSEATEEPYVLTNADLLSP